jgi:hypothetical protein
MAERRRIDPWTWALAAITAAGAALRFSTLRVQSFWLDEAVTHQLVTRTLPSMLSAIPHSESTPPLYYVAAWGWVRVFGAGEVGLRSLSALFGTATIVVLALIARRLAGNRAAIAAAALCATNPLLIWYSQEARAYALLVALCAISLWCLVREDWRGWRSPPHSHWRRTTSRSSWWSPSWAGSVGVTLAVAGRGPVGGVRRGGRRRARAAGDRAGRWQPGGLHPFDRPRRAHCRRPETVSDRLRDATCGRAEHSRRRTRAGALRLVCAAPTERLVSLAAIAIVVPVLIALAGADYLITRNLIAAMVPLVALAAVGCRAQPRRAGGDRRPCARPVLVAFAGVEFERLLPARRLARRQRRRSDRTRPGPRLVVDRSLRRRARARGLCTACTSSLAFGVSRSARARST